MGKVDKFTNKALIISEKVGNNVYLKAISNGLMATLPINIIGSLALLLAVLPVKPWTDFIGKIGLTATLLNTYSLTVGVISIYASFLIGYQLASNLKQNSMSAGIVSLLSFLILTPMVTLDKITTLNNSKLGAAGLFTAMIASLLFSRIYCYFNAKSVGIKMPDSVPPFVRNVFANLVPLIISASSAIFLRFCVFNYCNTVERSFFKCWFTVADCFFPNDFVVFRNSWVKYCIGLHCCLVFTNGCCQFGCAKGWDV